MSNSHLTHTRTGNQQLMKEINRILIFNAIRENGPIARSQLAKNLKLSPTTVTVFADEFIENGFLQEIGKADSSGGRKPVLVQLNPNAGQVIAVDLGQKLVALMNMDADIIMTRSMPEASKEQLVDVLTKTIFELMENYKKQGNLRLLGIGIAVPGIIDRENGKVITASNMNIFNFSLKEELQKNIQVPVVLENDANAAAYGEFLYGNGQQVPNFLYVHAGKAIGAGLFLSGNLYTGGAGGAGEFGHITVDENGPLCHCGNIGCLGKLINEKALLARWHDDGVGQSSEEPVSLQALVELSNQGDERAVELMSYAGEMIGRGLISLVHLFNPSLILLGGELALNNQHLFRQVKSLLEKRCIPVFSNHVQIEESATKLNSGLIGAGAMALHHFFQNLNMDQVWEG